MGEDIRETLRSNLIELLAENKMTQKELSENLEISQAAVTNWVKGSNSPTIDIVEKICEIFQIPISRILTKKEPPKPIEPVTEVNKEIWENEHWLEQFVIDIGWISSGEKLSEKQYNLLRAIIILLQEGSKP